MSEFQPSPDQNPTVWGSPPTPPVPAAAPASTPVGAVSLDHAAGDEPAHMPGSDGQPARRKVSTMAKTLTAVGVAAVIAVGGTIAVTSANASGSSSTAQGAPGGGGQGGSGGFGGTGATDDAGATGTGATGTGTTGTRGGGFGEMAVIGSALHGEFVVADGTGTITERIQTGAVTAVSSTSITVRSTDDYSATYALTSGLDLSAFTTGTDVTVIAKLAGTTVTATSITAARTVGGMGTAPGAPGGSGTGRRAPGGTGSGGTGSGSTGGTDSGAPTI